MELTNILSLEFLLVSYKLYGANKNHRLKTFSEMGNRKLDKVYTVTNTYALLLLGKTYTTNLILQYLSAMDLIEPFKFLFITDKQK